MFLFTLDSKNTCKHHISTLRMIFHVCQSESTSGSWRQAWYDMLKVDLSIILCHSISPSLPKRCNRCSKSFSVTMSCSLSSAVVLGLK